MTAPELLKQAIAALQINVPVMRWAIDSDSITLWLYGRAEPETWTKPKPELGAAAAKKSTRRRGTNPPRGDKSP